MPAVDIVIPCYALDRDMGKVVDAVLAQVVPSGVCLRAILVNDGSTPNAVPNDMASERVTVLWHKVNRGRAAARNTGGRAGSGKFIWFLDSDCVPESTATLHAHLECIAGCDVSVGTVRTKGEGFWFNYQKRIADARISSLRRNIEATACTSANVLIRRCAFEAVSGFDERYTKYGFEDRDLFLRMNSSNYRIGFAEHAAVLHETNLTLATVCRKMNVAGQYSSTRFRACHPVVYRNMAYGRLDTRGHGRLFGILCIWLWRILKPAIQPVNRMLEVRSIPIVIRAAIVKLFSGSAYAYGTLFAEQDSAIQVSHVPYDKSASE